MTEKAHETLSAVLPPDLQGALPELVSAGAGLSRLLAPAPCTCMQGIPSGAQVPYWTDSFGNSTRIDYGTGHETCFVAFLYCLARLGVLQPGDAAALGLRVFDCYVQLMRRVQTTYWCAALHCQGSADVSRLHVLFMPEHAGILPVLDVTAHEQPLSPCAHQAGASRLARRVGPG